MDSCCEPPDSWYPLLLPRPDRHSAEPVLARCRGERALASFSPAEQAAIERARGDDLVALMPPGRPDAGAGVLVISPHPDDAVLSLGAALAGARGTVADVFSRETWSPRAFYARRPELTAATILEEERIGCRILGAEPVFLDFPDAPLRGVSPFSATASDDDLTLAVADALREVVESHDVTYAPLGIGNHVDHLICREATIRLIRDGTITPNRVSFYEDLPYAAFPQPSAAASGPAATAEVRIASTRETMAKTEAVRAYHVQLRKGVRHRVLAHGRAIGEHGLLGERLWRCDGNGPE
jgi:LmbE family N-acetylglucosaminyl deacetylase